MSNDLTFTRILKAPRALVWDCWTKPEHIVHWFTPKPHKTLAAELDLRPGGACNVTMEVEGKRHENPGVYLEVVEGRRLVFTDGYGAGWQPMPDPFMTAILEFEDHPEGTRYTVLVRHPTPEKAKSHEDMGFFSGWGTATDQLEAYAQTLI
jgi:uncharacterized protein YndB with AHSA1/START domain